MTKRALITGITGQDGSYLAEFLLEKGYEVHGIKRRASSFNTQRIDHIYEDPHAANPKLHLHYGDLTDSSNLTRILSEVRPDEVYNLGAQSHVAVSFESPESHGGCALRDRGAAASGGYPLSGWEKHTRFYQASTSELYGLVQEVPQRETTPFYPRSKTAVAKLYAYWITVNYREAYGLYACNGILFNHESPRLERTFVTMKITRGYVQHRPGPRAMPLHGEHGRPSRLGPRQGLRPHAVDDAPAGRSGGFRDWRTGHLQYSVREFITWSAAELGITLAFEGVEAEEYIVRVVAVSGDKSPAVAEGQDLVRVDPQYFRPAVAGDPPGGSGQGQGKAWLDPRKSPRRSCAQRWWPRISLRPSATPSSRQNGRGLPVAVEI